MLGEDDRNQSSWGHTPDDQVQGREDHSFEQSSDRSVERQSDTLPSQFQPSTAHQPEGVSEGQTLEAEPSTASQPSATSSQPVRSDYQGSAASAFSSTPQPAAPLEQPAQPQPEQVRTAGEYNASAFAPRPTSPVQPHTPSPAAWSQAGVQQTEQVPGQGQTALPETQVTPPNRQNWGGQAPQATWVAPSAGYPRRPDPVVGAHVPSADPTFKGYVDSSAQPGQGTQPGQPQPGAQGSYSTPFQPYSSSSVFAAPAGGSGQPNQSGQPGGSRGAGSTFKLPKLPKKGPGWLALVVAMVVTALVAGGGSALVASYYTGSSEDTSAAATTASNASQTTQSTVPQVTSQGDSPDWQAVSKAVGPAVVTINVTTQNSQAVGSGVVYDQAGHIVTNYHVISTATSDPSGEITVTLSNGSLYKATVIGYDQTTDLAVIALQDPPSDLTVARFGSSADVTVGQNVMAIGAPLGLSNTVTTGVISALDRPVEVSTSDSDQQQQEIDPNDPFGQLEGMRNQNQNTTASDSVVTNAIQVDASINPGNSGGPLFDQTGAVIGINSSIASMSSSNSEAGSIGLGFAIPSDLVKSVADQLISTGKVNHGVLGVTIQDGTATVNGSTRLGAKVASVTSGSAADQAGIKEGDVILSVGGKQVVGSKSLTGFIRTYQSGAQVKLEVARDGAVQTLQATLQAATSEQ